MQNGTKANSRKSSYLNAQQSKVGVIYR